MPVVTVLLTGRPLYCNAEINRSDAVLVAWLPGGEGGGVADVLFGHHPVSGRLPFSWPAVPGDTALHPEDADRAGFAFGYGLEFGQADPLGVLPEEGMPGEDSGQIEIFARGVLRPGWELRLADDGEDQGRMAGGSGSSTSGALTLQTVDGGLQGSARRIEWTGPGALTIGIQDTRAVSLVGDGAPLALLMRLRVGRLGDTSVRFGGKVALTETLRSQADGEWHELVLPLGVLVDEGLTLLGSRTVLSLTSTGALCIDIEELRLTGLPS